MHDAHSHLTIVRDLPSAHVIFSTALHLKSPFDILLSYLFPAEFQHCPCSIPNECTKDSSVGSSFLEHFLTGIFLLNDFINNESVIFIDNARFHLVTCYFLEIQYQVDKVSNYQDDDEGT